MPMASIRAYMVVGPTNTKPCFFRPLDRATDSGDVVTISSVVAGAGPTNTGTAAQMQFQ